MTLTYDELVKRLAETLQKTDEEVSAEVAALVNRINEQAGQGEAVTIEGLGTFKTEEDKLVFIPDETLALEINHKYAGLEDIEVIGPDKEGEDEEIVTNDQASNLHLISLDEEDSGASDKSEEAEDDGEAEETDIEVEDEESEDEESGEVPKITAEDNEKKNSEIREQLDEVKQKFSQLETKKNIEDEKSGEEEETVENDTSEEEMNDMEEVSSDENQEDAAVDITNSELNESEEPEVTNEKEPVPETTKKDYGETVKKKPPVAKKPKKKLKKEKTLNGTVAIVIGVTGVVVVVALVWILVTYNGNQPNTNVLLGKDTPQTQTTNLQNKHSDQQKSMSPAVDDSAVSQKTSSDTLKTNKKPEKPAKEKLIGLKGEIATKNSDFYTIVVYSLTDHKRAEQVKQKLTQEHYRVSLTSSRFKDQYVFRIGLGQFKNVKNAEQAAKGLPPKFRKNHFIKHIHLKSTNE